MNARFLFVFLLAAALLVPAAGVAGEKPASPWLHVQVLEGGEDGARVNVNVPLSLAAVALKIADREDIRTGKVFLEGTEVTVPDLRAMWRELRTAGDAEFVTAREDDQSVRIFRKGDHVFVHVDGDEGETVRIQVPVSMVDALLSGENENELDLRAAIEELRGMTSGELVRVEDGEDTVRIWVE